MIPLREVSPSSMNVPDRSYKLDKIFEVTCHDNIDSIFGIILNTLGNPPIECELPLCSTSIKFKAVFDSREKLENSQLYIIGFRNFEEVSKNEYRLADLVRSRNWKLTLPSTPG